MFDYRDVDEGGETDDRLIVPLDALELDGAAFKLNIPNWKIAKNCKFSGGGENKSVGSPDADDEIQRPLHKSARKVGHLQEKAK